MILISHHGYSVDVPFSEADGYVIKSSSCFDELKRKVAGILASTMSHSIKNETKRCLLHFAMDHHLGTVGRRGQWGTPVRGPRGGFC